MSNQTVLVHQAGQCLAWLGFHVHATHAYTHRLHLLQPMKTTFFSPYARTPHVTYVRTTLGNARLFSSLIHTSPSRLPLPTSCSFIHLGHSRLAVTIAKYSSIGAFLSLSR